MKKKLSILAFSLCLLTCGVLFSACNSTPASIAFIENATLTREYNGEALTPNDIISLVDNKDASEVIIKFYQGETEVETPTNAGSYKIVVTNAKDTIEETFVITPKALKNIATLPSAWRNTAGERTFTISALAETAGGVLAGDDISIVVTTASYDLNADISNISITGEDADNYTLAKEDVIINVSLLATITSSEDSSKTLNVYVRYGDNNLYTNAIGALLTAQTITETFGENIQIVTSYNSSAVIDAETAKLLPLAQYSAGNLATDNLGRWIVPNGINESAINFIAQPAV